MIYEIKRAAANNLNENTNILVKASSETEALTIFKKQRLYEKGIKKSDYFASEVK